MTTNKWEVTAVIILGIGVGFMLGNNYAKSKAPITRIECYHAYVPANTIGQPIQFDYSGLRAVTLGKYRTNSDGVIWTWVELKHNATNRLRNLNLK